MLKWLASAALMAVTIPLGLALLEAPFGVVVIDGIADVPACRTRSIWRDQ